jgi:hypothetical protein
MCLVVVVDYTGSVLVSLRDAPALVVLVFLRLSGRIEVGALRLAAHTHSMSAVGCEAIRGSVVLHIMSKSSGRRGVTLTVTRLSQKATSCLFHWNRT